MYNRGLPGCRLHQFHIVLVSPVTSNIFKIKEQKSEMITSYRLSSVKHSGSPRRENPVEGGFRGVDVCLLRHAGPSHFVLPSQYLMLYS